jgi:hypothetical protein
MNPFPYENLSDEEFEGLTIRICKEILGIGAKTFSPGPDGGKDSWFEGTAEKFPSTKKPWTGKFIIQAKHTGTLNASCADNDFSVNKTSILAKEIDRLNEIKTENPFDNYIIFTNRKLPGHTHPTIVTMLRHGLSIEHAEIIGREQINTYLIDFPFIANSFGMHRFLEPLRFYEKDLRDLIVLFAGQSRQVSAAAAEYITNLDLIDKDEKNALNNLGKEYFDFMLDHSTKHFSDIQNFLTDPRNDQYTRKYANTVSDLQAKIILERNRFTEFQMVIEHLVSFLVENNEEKLIEQRQLVRVFIHFMYFNCDIGKTK